VTWGTRDVARRTADVTDEKAVAEAFGAAASTFGGVDLVSTTRGLSISKPLLETTLRLGSSARRDGRGSFLVSRQARSS